MPRSSSVPSQPPRIFDDQWIRDANEPELSVDKVIEPGAVVRLRNSARESFFAVVTAVEENVGAEGNAWIACVNNHLVRPAPYAFGDHVRFRRKDVIQLKTRADIEAQKQDPVLNLALQLLHGHLQHLGIITDDMGPSARTRAVEQHLLNHPERFQTAQQLARRMIEETEDF